MISVNGHGSGGSGTAEPFGDSDAARVDLTTLKKGLIVFPSPGKFVEDEDLESLDFNGSIRVIVGKKGAGKTLYLKLIQDSCKKNHDDNSGSIYFTDIDSSPPDSALIIKVSDWFDRHPGMAEEIWRRVWHIAILRTVFCHVFFKKEFDKHIRDFEKSTHSRIKIRFAEKYAKILPTSTVATNIYGQLKNVLTRFNSSKDLTNFLDLEEWTDFEVEMADLIKHLPPLYFFIDGLDEDYVHAPHHWLKCQVGLFNCIFRMIRNQQFGGRLHVIACLREFVYTFILQSEHGTRYLSESKIKVLKWNGKMLQYFFDRKISQLDDRYFVKKAPAEKNIENFLGFKELYNKRHQKNENVYEYIFRHTMLMPRDIINIGNKFCNNLLQVKNGKTRDVLLKESVSDVARQIASENLLLASLIINTRWIYKNAVEQNNLDSFIEESILEATKTNLMNLIKSIDKDRFSREELLEKKANRGEFGFSNDDFPLTALYHCGLLGFVSKDPDDNDEIQFFSNLKSPALRLPLTWPEYVFHSSLIDLLSIKPIGEPIHVRN